MVYATGAYVLQPALLPDPNTEFVATYQKGATRTEVFNPTKSGGTISLQLTQPPRPRSVQISYVTELADDGAPRSLEDVWGCVLRLAGDGSLLARVDAALATRLAASGHRPGGEDVAALAAVIRRGRVDQVETACAAVL